MHIAAARRGRRKVLYAAAIELYDAWRTQGVKDKTELERLLKGASPTEQLAQLRYSCGTKSRCALWVAHGVAAGGSSRRSRASSPKRSITRSRNCVQCCSKTSCRWRGGLCDVSRSCPPRRRLHNYLPTSSRRSGQLMPTVWRRSGARGNVSFQPRPFEGEGRGGTRAARG